MFEEFVPKHSGRVGNVVLSRVKTSNKDDMAENDKEEMSSPFIPVKRRIAFIRPQSLRRRV